MSDATYIQADRQLVISTPLGPDVLLAVGLEADEGVSRLFRLTVSAVADATTEVAFDRLVGRPVALTLATDSGEPRFYHGLCSRLSQGASDEHFCEYRLEVVPNFWLLTRRTQSRIFQFQTVPDILKEVLDGLDVSYNLVADYKPRDYCTQYRETDFAFASRLMEEEGIFYFFRHTESGHELVVADTPDAHAPLPGGTVIFESSEPDTGEERVLAWRKDQELRSGKVTLWDHCFEYPHKPLDADETTQTDVQVGGVAHKLNLAGNDSLELYDYPGRYAQRFDGVDRNGGDQPAALADVHDDNKRTAAIRMQQEASGALAAAGHGTVRGLTPGYRFTLDTVEGDHKAKRHLAEGEYVLTAVRVRARVSSDYRSGEWAGFEYRSDFECVPAALPFRPKMVTPRPVVPGAQTAVVAGPDGEEIFTDKYGRIKVQFHWDRTRQYNVKSSCWVRVGTPIAGQRWGMIHIPRVGQEVVVDFLEGDPDRPIVVGSVYNAEQMPPWPLPDSRKVTGFKSNSTPGGGGYNEMSFDDTKGKEKITFHGQYDMATTVQHDHALTVHNNRVITVEGTHTEKVKKDSTIEILEGNYKHDVKAGTSHYHGKGALTVMFDQGALVLVTGDQTNTVSSGKGGRGGNIVTEAEQGITITAHGKQVHIVGTTEIQLSVGKSLLLMKENGEIKLSGTKLEITGSTETKYGVGNQTVVCDIAKVAVSGAGINSSAVGVHEITGAVVKIN